MDLLLEFLKKKKLAGFDYRLTGIIRLDLMVRSSSKPFLWRYGEILFCETDINEPIKLRGFPKH